RLLPAGEPRLRPPKEYSSSVQLAHRESVMETAVPARWGFWAGAIAGMAMAALMLAIRLTLGIPALIEVLQDRAIPLVPVFLFTFFIQTFGSYAKQLLFGAVIIGLV